MAKTTGRKFKGIWIPAKLWLDEDLTIFEKAMLAEIDSLSVEDGCFAGNEYLARFFGISLRRVQQVIGKLVENGLIDRQIVREKSIKGGDRLLSLTGEFCRKYGDEGVKEIARVGVKEIAPGGCNKLHGGGERNCTPGVKEIAPLLYKEDNKVDNKGYNKVDNKKNSSSDLSKAVSLLLRLKVQKRTAEKWVETYSAEQVIAAVKNGLAKEKSEKEFTLEAGYVFRALSRSAKEGAKVAETAATRKLRKEIAAQNKTFIPKTATQIEAAKKTAQIGLGVGA